MACKPTNVLNIVYYNARSLLPKLDDLHLIAESVSPDVICIVETWLCGDISDSEIALQGYLVHRADRNRHGGGVLIYTKDSFVCNVLNPHDSLEIITLSIRTGVNKACFSLFYRPPASPIELLDDLFLYLVSIQSHYFCNNYILLGDFNIDFCNVSHSLSSKLSAIFNSEVWPVPSCLMSLLVSLLTQAP